MGLNTPSALKSALKTGTATAIKWVVIFTFLTIYLLGTIFVAKKYLFNMDDNRTVFIYIKGTSDTIYNTEDIDEEITTDTNLINLIEQYINTRK